jgi:5-methylcytosine-specific restriction endonuclease McrA
VRKCAGESTRRLSCAILGHMRRCEFCGGENLRTSRAIYCSVQCNKDALAARRKAGRWDGVNPSRECASPECSNTMEGKRPHARFCSRPCKARAKQIELRDSGVLRERDRARYASEAEKRREYAKQYLRDNPERMRAVRRNRKQRIKAERKLVTTKDWNRLVARYRNRCAYCGKRSEVLHRDHIIPLSRGGRHSIGNLLPACPPCNYRKKARLLADFRREVMTQS